MSNRSAVASWAGYEFANYAYGTNFLTMYFGLWVLKDLGAPDWVYSLAIAAALISTAIASPALGAASDRRGRRVPYVVGFTLLTVAATALLGFVAPLGAAALGPGLALFAVASFSFNMAQVCYNAQLPELGPPERRGALSGLGTAAGFAGSVVGLLLVMPFVSGQWGGQSGNAASFLPVAGLYLLFALPYFLLAKDRGTPNPSAGAGRFWARTWRSIRSARSIPGMVPYLIACLLFFDALSTVLGFMGIYCVKLLGFDEVKQEVQMLMLVTVLVAGLAAPLWGRLADRHGATRALKGVLACWVLMLVAILVVRDKALFTYGVGAFAGLASGGIFTVPRLLLSQLAPADRQAEFFGLYTIAGKFAAVIGPLSWGLVTFAFAATPALSYQLAMGVQLVFVAIGMALLTRVPSLEPPAQQPLARRV